MCGSQVNFGSCFRQVDITWIRGGGLSNKNLTKICTVVNLCDNFIWYFGQNYLFFLQNWTKLIYTNIKKLIYFSRLTTNLPLLLIWIKTKSHVNFFITLRRKAPLASVTILKSWRRRSVKEELRDGITIKLDREINIWLPFINVWTMQKRQFSRNKSLMSWINTTCL